MNASFLEVVQTLTAVAGAGLTTRAMVGADLNLVAQKRSPYNGNRRMIAEKNVRVERIVLSVQAMLFLLGLATLFLAPPPYTPVPDGGMPRSHVELDMMRSLTVTRLGMTMVSIVLMYLSYRNWLEERIPIQLARRTDSTSTASIPPSLAAAAQAAASHAQATATVAQDSASEAQEVATLAQNVASEAHEAEAEKQGGP